MNAAIATKVAPTSYKRLCRNVQFAATAQIATEVAPTVNTTPPASSVGATSVAMG